jgi:hypothetical protein
MALIGNSTGSAFHGSIEGAFRGGWRFFLHSTNTTGSGTREAFQGQSLNGQFRKNNDGPGWTSNRTTSTPDKFRPIPFKAIVSAAVSLIASLARRDLLGRR